MGCFLLFGLFGLLHGGGDDCGGLQGGSGGLCDGGDLAGEGSQQGCAAQLTQVGLGGGVDFPGGGSVALGALATGGVRGVIRREIVVVAGAAVFEEG